MGIYSFLLSFVLLLIALYIYISILFYSGWLKTPRYDKHQFVDDGTKVSVVVAARNEALHIQNCLTALASQDFSVYNLEVIIVDDNSDDGTAEICRTFINERGLKNFRLLELGTVGLSSKKEAVKYGVREAVGNFIMTTDADCIVKKEWVSTMVSFYKDSSAKMVCGPVNYLPKTGFFQAFQTLDFLSLIGSGAGAAGYNRPFMGNAANMGFEKELFEEYVLAGKGDNYASGDDVFLLHTIKKRFRGGVVFLKSSNAMVYTHSEPNLKALLEQRVRWTSKSKGYKDADSIFFALIVFLYNFMIVVAAIVSFFIPQLVLIYVGLMFVKTVADSPLLFSVVRFSKSSSILRYYLFIQLFYPFYISLVALVGLLKPTFSWKGRKTL